MKSISNLKHVLISALLLSDCSSVLAADVGVSVSIGQPSFYGRVDIGDYPYPQPRVIYSQPIIAHRQIEAYAPIYLRVPPGHAKKWRSYCGRYNACGRPVYFVQDRWYQHEYVPHYREYHGQSNYYHNENHQSKDRGHGHNRGNGKNKGKRHNKY